MNVCSIQLEAQKKYGRLAAAELITYLGDIEALDCAADLINLFDMAIEVRQNPSQLNVTLDFGLLILVPVASYSVTESGSASWETVTSLRLDTIEYFE